MSANQKAVYGQLVEGGVNKGYAAYTVKKSWAESFKLQPMQYIQGHLAKNVIGGKDQINSALRKKKYKQDLLKVLQSIA